MPLGLPDRVRFAGCVWLWCLFAAWPCAAGEAPSLSLPPKPDASASAESAPAPLAPVQSAPVEPELAPPAIVPGPAPQAAVPVLSEQELAEERREREQAIRRKLRTAELLLQVRKFDACVAACDDALAIDPTHAGARALRESARSLRLQGEEERIDSEGKLREAAVLQEMTKEAQPPHRGPDLPRPKIGEEDMPFSEEAKTREEARRLLQQRIPEINLVDADLNYVLQLLFKTTGVNIVYTPAEVEGKNVTIHARDLTLEDILKYLSRSLGVGYTLDRGTVWVYGAGGGPSGDGESGRALMKPVVIPLRTGLTRAGGESAVGGAAAAAAAAGAPAGIAGALGQGPGIGMQTSDIEDLMKWMESNWPGWPKETIWRLDRKFNRLILASTPDIVAEVKRMVAMLDEPPVQIMIAARFLQVSEDFINQIGLNRSIDGNPDNIPKTNVPPGGLTTDAAVRRDAFRDNKVRIVNTDTALGIAGANALTANMVSIINDHQLALTLQALQQKTRGRILTAPRVIALNNKEASIKLVRNYRYADSWEASSNSTVTDQTATTSTILIPTNIAEKELGYILRVFPSVGADMKTVTLQIVPEITDIDGFTAIPIVTNTPTGQQVTNQQIPTFQTNTLQVEAVVEDGQTVVVGGLSRDTLNDSKKGVPGLMKVPGLGVLFRNKDQLRDRNCLLIFVTANIVTSTNRHYADDPRAARDRAREAALGGVTVPAEMLNDWLGDPAPRGE